MKIFICKQPQSLRAFTDCTYPQGSFVFARLLREREIKVNGVRVDKNITLKAGDEVTYFTTPAQEAMPSHSVVYSDDSIAVVDKFSGVSSEGLCAELNTYGVYYPVHRLDRNTCGVMVYAKSQGAQDELIKAFRERRAKKTYHAVCKNHFSSPSGTLTAYLYKDEKRSLVKIYDSPVRGAQKTETGYRVLKTQDDLALVAVELHTGKTHQIRAQMAHIGCPVLGDGKYGDGALNKKYGMARQCLVAKRLKLTGLTGGLSSVDGRSFESGFVLDLTKITPKKQ